MGTNKFIGNLKKIKNMEQLKKIKKDSVIITILIIIILVGISEVYDFLTHADREQKLFAIYYIPILFCHILPTIYIVKNRLKTGFKEREEIKKYFMMLFYYLVFLPVLNFILGWNGLEIQRYIIIKLIGIVNILFLSYSIYRIIKYVFIDVVLKKRKIHYSDLKYVFASYIGIGVTFGFIYYMISMIFGSDSFSGYTESSNSLRNYFEFIYFSFITLATVGYGDITPVSAIGKFVVILEIISGAALVNLILAIVIGAGLFNQKDK